MMRNLGEFAAGHGTNGDVDELTTLKFCADYGQGSLGWSDSFCLGGWRWVIEAPKVQERELAKTWIDRVEERWARRAAIKVDWR